MTITEDSEVPDATQLDLARTKVHAAVGVIIALIAAVTVLVGVSIVHDEPQVQPDPLQQSSFCAATSYLSEQGMWNADLGAYVHDGCQTPYDSWVYADEVSTTQTTTVYADNHKTTTTKP